MIAAAAGQMNIGAAKGTRGKNCSPVIAPTTQNGRDSTNTSAMNLSGDRLNADALSHNNEDNIAVAAWKRRRHFCAPALTLHDQRTCSACRRCG